MSVKNCIRVAAAISLLHMSAQAKKKDDFDAFL